MWHNSSTAEPMGYDVCAAVNGLKNWPERVIIVIVNYSINLVFVHISAGSFVSSSIVCLFSHLSLSHILPYKRVLAKEVIIPIHLNGSCLAGAWSPQWNSAVLSVFFCLFLNPMIWTLNAMWLIAQIISFNQLVCLRLIYTLAFTHTLSYACSVHKKKS